MVSPLRERERERKIEREDSGAPVVSFLQDFARTTAGCLYGFAKEREKDSFGPSFIRFRGSLSRSVRGIVATTTGNPLFLATHTPGVPFLLADLPYLRFLSLSTILSLSPERLTKTRESFS